MPPNQLVKSIIYITNYFHKVPLYVRIPLLYLPQMEVGMSLGSFADKFLGIVFAVAITVAIVGSKTLPAWGDVLFIVGAVALVIKFIF